MCPTMCQEAPSTKIFLKNLTKDYKMRTPQNMVGGIRDTLDKWMGVPYSWTEDLT